MGAEPYWYFVKYREDLDAALEDLRRREFKAGRYHPALATLSFPVDPSKPGPGAKHDSIDEALEDADADGTGSILDLDHISEEAEFCGAELLSDEELEEFFGTPRPTRAQVEACDELWDRVERGQGLCIVCYKNDQPDEIYFAGYSYD